MTQNELIGIGYYGGLALLVAVAAIIGLGVTLQVDRAIGRWTACLMVPAMLLGTALSSLLSGRDLKYAFSNIESIAFGSEGGGSGVLRLVTAAMLALGGATVITDLFGRRRHGAAGPQTVAKPASAGQALLLAYAAFFLCNAIFNAAFGTKPAFTHNILYLPVAFAAVYVWRQEPVDNFVRLARWMLIAFMVGSLILAVAKPSLALQPAYKGWVPGLTVRLWGLGSNPNSIGPLALLLLLLEWMQPSRRWLARGVVVALALVVLGMAQSKTTWAAGLVMAVVVAWYRFGKAPAGGVRIGFVLALIAGLLMLCIPLATMDLGRFWDKLAVTSVGTDVSTFTGRAQIWVAALAAWRDNPVFGYGLEAWGPAHRAALGMPFAFSAHNQFLQSMSTAGTLGLISLLVYLAVLGLWCFRAATVTRGASAALFVFVLLRCITEAAVTPSTLFNGDAVTHLILFRLALCGVAVAKPLARTATVQARLLAAKPAGLAQASMIGAGQWNGRV